MREVPCKNGSRIRIEEIAGSALGESFRVTLLSGEWMPIPIIATIVDPLAEWWVDQEYDPEKPFDPPKSLIVKLRHRP